MSSNHPTQARHYLQEFYSSVEFENSEILAFLSDVARNCELGTSVADLGCGPTVYTLLPFARSATEFTLLEPNDTCFDELTLWHQQDNNSWNWNEFGEWVIRHNNWYDISAEELLQLTRQKVVSIRKRKWQTLHGYDSNFSTLLSLFCHDASTTRVVDFASSIATTLRTLCPEGNLILGVLLECDAYKIGEKWLPNCWLTVDDIVRVLPEYKLSIVNSRLVDAPIPGHQGYSSFALYHVVKS